MKINWDNLSLPSVTFACGPAQMLPTVREMPLYQTFLERSHRADDISTHGLYRRATEELRTLMHIPEDYTVCFFAGGATIAMEAVLWSLTKDSLCGLSFGAFSKRWTEELPRRLPFPFRHTVCQPFGNDFFPAQQPDYSAGLILLTPNETSTGVQIPNRYLEDVWQFRGEDTLVAWDTTSCAGGRELPAASYDVQVFGLQKCFGAGGGTAGVILSPKAVARISEVKKMRTIPYALDLSLAAEQAKQFQTVNTPSTVNIWLCCQACQWMNKNGGIRAMDILCRTHAAYLEDWAAKSGYVAPMIEDELFRSYTTLTLRITHPQIKDTLINNALAATGLANLQDGIKKHRSVTANSLRIACFPFVDTTGVTQYQQLTASVDHIIRHLI